MEHSVDTVAIDLKEKYFMARVEDVNKKIRDKGYLSAKIIPKSELEARKKDLLFSCVYEPGRTFYDVVSEIYKINCKSIRTTTELFSPNKRTKKVKDYRSKSSCEKVTCFHERHTTK